MRKLFIINNDIRYISPDMVWYKGIIEQNLNAIKIETAPKEVFLKYLIKDYKILDAGCGFGKWVIYLNQRGYDVIGIDNNNIAISKLKDYNRFLQVELGNIKKLNFPDNYFDVYISMGVVEHFEQGPYLALKEAYRVLKPNGLIFISTPTVNIIRKVIIQPILNIINRSYQLFTKIKNFFENSKLNQKTYRNEIKKNKKLKYYHFLEYRFSVKEMHTFLKKCNFKVIETLPHDFHGSKDHAIGLSVDFPFLRKRHSINFELNRVGKFISLILDSISPWIATASVLCVGRSLKEIKLLNQKG
ncbi:MAG: class I SAM-dependent methyltransferase [Promethearchaeota archaeon]